ncbi:MAG: PLDc_N domain-containing protein [Firmicutes bacterium]|nr:PLDc_N domain-containing protein [Bacillota bacterium]HOB35493.1 PLD nuclease N-terminal domain-containing protein [Bacillota bacterium]HPZ90475.1 PLD nuclease N-terminal domain-containing protein [Bacillota bacterium]HQE02335.1 PLD nuclease N-terminal domain-containing protein [Bacillota bacterium]
MEEFFRENWPLFIPVVLINYALVAAALVNLFRRQISPGKKWLWAAVIVFIQYLGPLCYFIFGRKE